VTPTLLYAVGCVGMLVGAGIGARLVSLRRDRRWAWAVAAIPAIAASMYAAMALGIGTVSVDGTAVPAPRYVDWLLTTPILVGFVAVVAGADRRGIAAVVGTDAAMIGIGWVAVVTSGVVEAVAFGLSSLCYVGLLWALYRWLPGVVDAADYRRRRLFGLLQNHVGLLWVAYPIVWIAGPLGVGLVSSLAVALAITYMDVAAKVPYVYFVLAHREAAFGADDAGDAGAETMGESVDVTVGD